MIYIDDILKPVIFLLVVFLIINVSNYYIDIKTSREKQIIENTKEFVQYTNCHEIDSIYYCWNEKK